MRLIVPVAIVLSLALGFGLPVHAAAGDLAGQPAAQIR